MIEIKAGVFDINGTIQEKTGVPLSIVSAFHFLGSIGVRTTIATGRGYRRALQLLEGRPDSIISQGMPRIVENGGRIVSPSGENLRYHALPTEVSDMAIDAIRAVVADVEYVAYYPRQPKADIQYWSPDGEVAQKFIARHGPATAVCADGFDQLARRITRHKPCMLIVKPRDMGVAGSFTGANVELNEGELNVLDVGVNKGSGVVDVSEQIGVSLEHFMVAGNDHNDRSMFELPTGLGIHVGEKPLEVTNSKKLVHVATPSLLGTYLKELLNA